MESKNTSLPVVTVATASMDKPVAMNKIENKAEIDLKEKETLEQLMFTIDTLDCRGKKCRIHIRDGYEAHCIACCGELNVDAMREAPEISFAASAKAIGIDLVTAPSCAIKSVYCSGLNCRIHKKHGRGIHCVSCFGE